MMLKIYVAPVHGPARLFRLFTLLFLLRTPATWRCQSDPATSAIPLAVIFALAIVEKERAIPLDIGTGE